MHCKIASIWNHLACGIKAVKAGVMEVPSAATNEVSVNGIEIIHDHQQKQRRDIIESYRILPNNCTFFQLDEDIHEYIKTLQKLQAHLSIRQSES